MVNEVMYDVMIFYFKFLMLSYLHNNTTAANNFPGFAFFVNLAETRPFPKFLVVVNLKSHSEHWQ